MRAAVSGQGPTGRGGGNRAAPRAARPPFLAPPGRWGHSSAANPASCARPACPCVHILYMSVAAAASAAFASFAARHPPVHPPPPVDGPHGSQAPAAAAAPGVKQRMRYACGIDSAANTPRRVRHSQHPGCAARLASGLALLCQAASSRPPHLPCGQCSGWRVVRPLVAPWHAIWHLSPPQRDCQQTQPAASGIPTRSKYSTPPPPTLPLCALFDARSCSGAR